MRNSWNKRMKKNLCGILLLAMILSVMPSEKAVLAKAAKVQIYDTVQGNAEHRSMEMGQVRGNFSVKLSSGTIKSVSWSSNNEKVIMIEERDGPFVNLTARDEGTALLQVTVVTAEGQTLTDTCTISVYTKRTRTEAQLKTEADFFRAASIQSVVRRHGAVGQEFTIIASCGNFYRVILPDSYVFEDTLTHQYAYVLKQAVYIPVTEVKLSETSLQLEKKSHRKLSVTVLPQLAGNKAVEWSSSNKKVASVTKAGKVTAKGYGTAVIKVRTKDKGKTATCKVEVKKKVRKAKKSKRKTISATNINPNGKYIFRFDNHDDAFGEHAKYYLTKKDEDKLIKKVYRGKYQEDTYAEIRKYVRGESHKLWEGSCYGMSAVVVLNRGKKIHARKYCKSKRGEPYVLRYLDLPKDNKQVMSLINYYQLSQAYMRSKTIDCNKKTCSRLIKNAKKNRLQLFGFSHSTGEHEIVLKKYVKTKKGYVWISAYDSIAPKEEIYIKINKKTGKVKSSEYENMHDCEFVDDFSIFNAIKIDTK